MKSKHAIADYSNEPLDKELDSESLVEAIHEYLEPKYSHNEEYLLLRINILRRFYNLTEVRNNENVRAIDALLNGYGKVQELQVLPFDGAMELPNTIDTQAHQVISNRFSEEIDHIRHKTYEIHRAYIRFIVIESIEPSLKDKKIKLEDLIRVGLPRRDPGEDVDNW